MHILTKIYDGNEMIHCLILPWHIQLSKSCRLCGIFAYEWHLSPNQEGQFHAVGVEPARETIRKAKRVRREQA